MMRISDSELVRLIKFYGCFAEQATVVAALLDLKDARRNEEALAAARVFYEEILPTSQYTTCYG